MGYLAFFCLKFAGYLKFCELNVSVFEVLMLNYQYSLEMWPFWLFFGSIEVTSSRTGLRTATGDLSWQIEIPLSGYSSNVNFYYLSGDWHEFPLSFDMDNDVTDEDFDASLSPGSSSLETKFWNLKI